ncbi:glycosyltransferase family 25 protein [Pseudidiomarina terrestris]|uniref:glycosyltransferase family 25 protein n=1 Tax=Pseudidiomarina terrestris TaxID=2820060 RepID=UPI00264B9E1E|nr:glycosyltransferase family 25 protein [Pseudidiomarina sp. 1ASP75-5]MDN7134536.1 glycosyltransferase family 25 protein [Pseudidiomarina sp. 1ASP75-5]
MNCKAFLINLADHGERRHRSVKLIENIGVDYEVIPAVDGRVKNDRVEELVKRSNSKEIIGRQIGTREIACALSHLKCYHSLITSPLNWALVLEDDIQLREMTPSEFNQTFTQILEHVHTTEPTVILLGHHLTYERTEDGKPRLFSRKSCVLRDRNMGPFSERPSGGYAYLINRTAAEQRILEMEKIDYPIDYWLPKNYRLTGLFPPLVDFDSNIESEIQQDRQPSLEVNTLNATVKKILLRSRSYLYQLTRSYD